MLAESLTQKEIQAIDADPILRKRHRQMQQGFTAKTGELATRSRDIQIRELSLKHFFEELDTPEGALAHFEEQLKAIPDLIPTAFGSIAKDPEHAVDFLTQVGIANPERLEEAYERVQELQNDPRAKKLFEGELKVKSHEGRTAMERERALDKEFRERSLGIRADVVRFVENQKIDKDDRPALAVRIKEAVNANLTADNMPQLSTKEVSRIVREFAQEMQERDERLLARIAKKDAKQPRKEQPKSKGAGRVRTPSSGGVSRKPSSRGSKPKGPRPGQDPVDFAVDQAALKHFPS